MKSLQQVPIDEVIAAISDATSSLNTRLAYTRVAREFLRWSDGAEISGSTVLKYREHLVESGASPQSVNLALSAIRCLARVAVGRGWLPAASAEEMKAVRRLPVRKEGATLTGQEAARLLTAPSPDTLRGLRDRALIALIVDCRLRRSEVVDLKVEQFQKVGDQWVLVGVEGYGGRLRSVPMSPLCHAYVEAWLTAGGIREGNVIRSIDQSGSINGPSITRNGISHVLNRYAEKIGLRSLSPDALRKAGMVCK